MQIPTNVLNIGGDVAKDEIVVACSEGNFPTRPLANQRAALLAFLKTLAITSAVRPHLLFIIMRTGIDLLH
jgi:hypothetical protein